MPPAIDENMEMTAAASNHSLRSDTNVLTLENDDPAEPNQTPPVDATSPIPVNGEPQRVWSAHHLHSIPDTPKTADSLEPPEDGILEEKWLQRGLKNIGKIAEGFGFCFLDLSLTSLGLQDISIISSLPLLQNVTLSYNKLVDLSAFSELKNLLILDVSNNMLESLDSLPSLSNLRRLNASNNVISGIGDLSRFPALQFLFLENNRITQVEGIDRNRRLKYLNLASNQINVLENIADLPIQELNISNNSIKDLAAVQDLKYIQTLDFSYNDVTELSGLQNRDLLQNVDAQNNKINDFDQLAPLVKSCKLLRILNLRNNTIQELEDYRLAVLFRCSTLIELDKRKVQPEEKVAALNKFSPPPEVVASRDHINQVVYKHLQPARLRECTLPSSDTPYPILVLVGPEASGKIELANRLVQEFPDFFGYLPNHVVRSSRDTSVLNAELEQSNVCLENDEFLAAIKDGRFVSTYTKGSRTFGIMYDIIENIASEGLACVTHMEYEGVLSFKKSFFEPRYLLILPKSREIHEEILRSTYQMADEEVKHVLERARMYEKINQDKPGFFDQVIDSNNTDEALGQLTDIVKEYLGLPSDYVAQSSSASGADRETKGSRGVTENALRYKLAGTSGNSGSRRGDMNSVELKSHERRESAIRAVIRDNSLTPESPYGNVVYGPPYTAPAAVESRDSRKAESAPVQQTHESAAAADEEDEEFTEQDLLRNEDLESPLERPDLAESYLDDKLQERASSLLQDDALLDSELRLLFKTVGKTHQDTMNLTEAKELMKTYFQTSLFEIPFGPDDERKFETSFYTYTEMDSDLQRQMTFDEFKGWFMYMLRMIRFGLYANQS